MKKLTLTFCAIVALASGAFAGTESYSGKEMKSTAQAPCPTWYADNEWDIGVSGVYAPTNESWISDRYLGVDHAWGGAIDFKYFWRRYFGFGVQGFGLALDDTRFSNFPGINDSNNFAGGVLGTFTFRYPIPCTRFAPYAWAGVGGIWGGSGSISVNDAGVFTRNSGNGALMGQYGAGFEVRFTPHFGWTNDISFNQVDGPRNDFWQIRSGLNFAF